MYTLLSEILMVEEQWWGTEILGFIAGCEEECVVVVTCTSACSVFHPQLDSSFTIPFSLSSSCPKSLSVFILFSFPSPYKSKSI